MSLKDQITEDMKTAMKAGDKDRLKVVRLMLAAIKQVEIDTREELDDTAILGIVQIHLTVQNVCNEAPIGAEQRHTGLIAACFDAENDHRRRMIPHRKHCGSGIEILQTFANHQIRRYYVRLSPGHAPGLFMSGRNT